VQVNHDLELCISCPRDGPIEILKLTLDVWVFVSWSHSPVPDWDPDVVETSSCNFLEIIFCDPSVPVRLQSVCCLGFPELLRVCIFVYDIISPREISRQTREDPRSYPWFEDKPLPKLAYEGVVVALTTAYTQSKFSRGTVQLTIRQG